jgi:hypothetical protein
MLPVPVHVIPAAANSNPSATTTVLIAFPGALLGAGIGAFTQWRLDRARAKREEVAHKKLIKVAARMMLVDLSRAESNIGFCIEHKSWWKTTGLSPRLDPSDRRLVLGELDSKGFYAVDRAEGAIDHWYGIRKYELDNQDGYNSETIRIQISKLEEIVGWIEEARKPPCALTGDPSRSRGARRTMPRRRSSRRSGRATRRTRLNPASCRRRTFPTERGGYGQAARRSSGILANPYLSPTW